MAASDDILDVSIDTCFNTVARFVGTYFAREAQASVALFAVVTARAVFKLVASSFARLQAVSVGISAVDVSGGADALGLFNGLEFLTRDGFDTSDFGLVGQVGLDGHPVQVRAIGFVVLGKLGQSVQEFLAMVNTSDFGLDGHPVQVPAMGFVVLGQLGQPVQAFLAMGFVGLVPTDRGVVSGRVFFIPRHGSAGRGDKGGQERDNREEKVHGGDGG